MDERTRTRSARNDRLTYIGQMMNIKKAAPKWSHLSEQLTRCALCVNNHKPGHDNRDQAGGQLSCLLGPYCAAIFIRSEREYFFRNSSRTKAHGANLSDSCSSAIFSCSLFVFCDGVVVDSLLVIVCTCKAMRRSTSHHGADSDYSDSLALRRWRRLISPSSAETINCPVLSPSSFKFSTASAIAWGTRASSFLDFPLTAFVAISDSLVIRWLTVYTQENGKTLLTWLTPVTNIVADTFIKVIDEKTKPAGATNTNGLLTTNVNEEPLWLP